MQSTFHRLIKIQQVKVNNIYRRRLNMQAILTGRKSQNIDQFHRKTFFLFQN